MKIVRLQSAAELKTREKLPQMPALVRRYLEEKPAEAKNFRIQIEGKNTPRDGHGIAYSNTLRIERREGNIWREVYNTGMMQYRGAYNYEIDNWDLHIQDTKILEDSEDGFVFALKTGVRNVKIYRFNSAGLKLQKVFSLSNYEAVQSRLELVEEAMSSAEAFRSYVENGLGNRWHTASKIELWDNSCQIFGLNGRRLEDSDYGKVAEKVDVVVLLAQHYDRDYDPIADLYKIFVWVRGKGISETDVDRTGLSHPDSRFYCESVGLEAAIKYRGKNFLNLTAKVVNSNQRLEISQEFRIKWSGSEVR